MKTETFDYLIKTLATWGGVALALSGIWQLVHTFFGVNDRTKAATRATIALLIGGALTFAGAKSIQTTDQWVWPLVWVVMPFTGWLALAGVGFAVLRGAQSFSALNQIEQRKHIIGSATWVGISVGSFILLKESKDPTIILKGVFSFNLPTLLGLVFLLFAGAILTALATKSALVRGVSKTIALQGTLFLGSLLFAFPFAWLLITSFKEERDMSSANGIVWIPKVQQTVPYMDPKDPLIESVYKGSKVQGSILKRLEGGSIQIDISKPMALRGNTFAATTSEYKEIPKAIPLVIGNHEGKSFKGKVIEEMLDGKRRVVFLEPGELKDQEHIFKPAELEPYRLVGLRVKNYPEALDYLPAETNQGLVYLKNTLILVIMSILGTLISSTMVAYAFARINFPGREFMFKLVLSTMMLPGAVTLLPQFLIFRSLGWINTLLPIWVPTFFASAFNIFLLRQFFKSIPGELEDAARIDGCNHPKILRLVMVPQIKPALAVIAVWTFMGAWNNFMGPLIYLSSPENMPLSYALQLFNGERVGEPGLLMAFTTLTILPVLALFFFAQKYFVEGVTLSGLGGR